MPLQKLVHSIESPLQGEVAKFPYLNQIIDYCNNLERRLEVLERQPKLVCHCTEDSLCNLHRIVASEN